MMDLYCSEIINNQKWVKVLKMCPKHQIPYYHPLNEQLIGQPVINNKKECYPPQPIRSLKSLIWIKS